MQQLMAGTSLLFSALQKGSKVPLCAASNFFTHPPFLLILLLVVLLKPVKGGGHICTYISVRTFISIVQPLTLIND